MPACFALLDKLTGKMVSFQEIDDKMRIALGHPPDPKQYLMYWRDFVGLQIAVGHTWDQIRDDMTPEYTPIVNWLEANYEKDCWYER